MKSAAMKRTMLVAVAMLALGACRRDRVLVPGTAGCAVDDDCEEAQEHCHEHARERDDVDELPHARDACMDAGMQADRIGDVAAAAEAYRLACELGDARGCGWAPPASDAAAPADVAGPAVEGSEPPAAPPPPPVAVLGDDAHTCDRGDARACYRQGLRVSDEESPAWMKRACDGGDSDGCLAYGEALERGQWVDQDELEATLVYRRLCDADVAEGCKRAVVIAQRNPAAARLLDTMNARQRRNGAEPATAAASPAVLDPATR
jgi:TPR repeat protein